MTAITENQLPYLTEDIPGSGGKIKRFWKDFIVEEVPLYEPSGEGTHLYVNVEKRGMATLDVIVKLSRALKVSRQAIGHAGLKDAKAVTRQWLSIEHVTKEEVEKLDLNNITIIKSEYHTNKLRIGHLKSNRFIIRIRELDMPLEEAESRAGQVMELLRKHGTPNYFGPQRFGKRQDSPQLGQYVIKGEYDNFIDLYLGCPRETDQSPILDARTYYDSGDYQSAHDAWPAHFHDQRLALRALTKGKSKESAFNYLNKQIKRFYVSSLQSYLFNQVVTKRMPNIDRLFVGDIAWKHNNGSCFIVESAEDEQSRCESFEISPTGPLFGHQMLGPMGEAEKIEQDILEQNHILADHFHSEEMKQLKGGRRPLRFRPRNVHIRRGEDDRSEFLEIRFELSSGCYATSVIREITKAEVQ